jgi:hypothetical protein
MTSPRPDQRVPAGAGVVPGSRSGSGELAGALGYPGVPSAVPNCLGAALFQQTAASTPTIVTLPESGRIWLVDLSYVITSNNSFSLATSRTVCAVQAAVSGLTLATIQLGVSGPNQHDSGQKATGFPGLPLVKGESLILNVNNGNVVTDLDQQASVSVLYSIP